MDREIFKDKRKKNHKELVVLRAAVHRGFNFNAKGSTAKFTVQTHSITNSSVQR